MVKGWCLGDHVQEAEGSRQCRNAGYGKVTVCYAPHGTTLSGKTAKSESLGSMRDDALAALE